MDIHHLHSFRIELLSDLVYDLLRLFINPDAGRVILRFHRFILYGYGKGVGKLHPLAVAVLVLIDNLDGGLPRFAEIVLCHIIPYLNVSFRIAGAGFLVCLHHHAGSVQLVTRIVFHLVRLPGHFNLRCVVLGAFLCYDHTEGVRIYGSALSGRRYGNLLLTGSP